MVMWKYFLLLTYLCIRETYCFNVRERRAEIPKKRSGIGSNVVWGKRGDPDFERNAGFHFMEDQQAGDQWSNRNTASVLTDADDDKIDLELNHHDNYHTYNQHFQHNSDHNKDLGFEIDAALKNLMIVWTPHEDGITVDNTVEATDMPADALQTVQPNVQLDLKEYVPQKRSIEVLKAQYLLRRVCARIKAYKTMSEWIPVFSFNNQNRVSLIDKRLAALCKSVGYMKRNARQVRAVDHEPGKTKLGKI